jgi:hypothetical protein
MKVRIEVADGAVINVCADVDCEVQIIDHDLLDMGNYMLDDVEVDATFYDIAGAPLVELTPLDR